MAENSKIEWCDHTFNPWVGCTKVSPACDHCYAEGWAKRYGKDFIEAAAAPIVLATEEQVAEIRRLLSIINLPQSEIDKALTKAKAELVTITETAIGATRNLSAVTAEWGATITNTAIPPARNLEAVIKDIAGEIPSIPRETEKATRATRDYFAGLYNDIARGWATTIQNWMSGTVTWRDFTKNIFEDIKSSFFRLVGEMITEFLMNFVKKAIAGVIDVGVSIAKNITGAAKMGTDAIGKTVGAASSLATTIGVVGIAAMGLASIIQAFKKGPDFTYTNRLLEEQNWVYLTGINQKLDALNEKTAAVVDKNDWMGNNLDIIRGASLSMDNTLHGILSTLGSLKGAQHGAKLTKPQLVMTHGTAERPEWIVPQPDIPAFISHMQNREAAGAGGGGVSVTVNLNGTMITDREYMETRLIREFTDALRSAPVQRNVQRALGISGVGA